MPSKFDFPKQKGMQTYSAIYVPSTTDRDKPISKAAHRRRAEETRRFLNDKFGGTTTVSTVGSFTIQKGKDKGRVVKEPVFKVENFSDNDDWNKNDQEVQAFVERKQQQWGQESMGFEFEAPNRPRRLLFVSAPTNKKRNLRSMT